jgi:hypothetical protein
VDELVEVALSDDERGLLQCGLLEWGGPARCTDALAVAMGFSDLADFDAERDRLRDALADGQPLTVRDWSRTLLATEIVFASDVVGSGLDWSITTGLRDHETIALLRRVQRKMPRWRPTAQFTIGEAGEVAILDADRLDPGEA